MSDGGVCCIGSNCEPSSEAECKQINGDFKPGPPKPVGICFMTQVILDYLDEEHKNDGIVRLIAGGTYSSLFDARDHILKKCVIGRKALDIYRKHGMEVLLLSRKDWELRRQMLYTFLKLAMFSRALIRYVMYGQTEPESKGSYTMAMHKELIALTYRLEASGASVAVGEDFRSLLADVQDKVDLPIPEFFIQIGIGIDKVKKSTKR